MVIINKGKTVVEGKVKDLLNDGNETVVIKFNKNAKIEQALVKFEYDNKLFQIEKDVLKINISEDEIPKLIRNLVLENINIFSVEKENTLEDYFLKITEET